MLRRFALVMGLLVGVATPLFAEKSASTIDAEENTTASKFTVDGDTLIYNSQIEIDGRYAEISEEDIDLLAEHLRQNKDISVLQLTSSGGVIWVGADMAQIVLDFELDTLVVDECSSACVTVFLAGARREMTRGSRIGFHQSSWDAQDIQDYYKYWREQSHWHTPWDFAAWLYGDTQHETAEQIAYMLARGVDPEFAVETKKYRPGMWFPSRQELQTAGVLRE
ncbi:hypothetical protein [Loktanella sp. Alg231-35]|uniref:COG3904 family protein n=1 Tax=Loktanella sp. Alg231-35 TaxID=1922220 RepID=UPI001F3AD66F|nr:hypothetical protein [Loktanella sp. Alg231-35]